MQSLSFCERKGFGCDISDIVVFILKKKQGEKKKKKLFFVHPTHNVL